jgi:hypothetical protein
MDTHGLIHCSVMVSALNGSGFINSCHLSTTANHGLKISPQCPSTRPVLIWHDVDDALTRGSYIRRADTYVSQFT